MMANWEERGNHYKVNQSREAIKEDNGSSGGGCIDNYERVLKSQLSMIQKVGS